MVPEMSSTYARGGGGAEGCSCRLSHPGEGAAADAATDGSAMASVGGEQIDTGFSAARDAPHPICVLHISSHQTHASKLGITNPFAPRRGAAVCKQHLEIHIQPRAFIVRAKLAEAEGSEYTSDEDECRGSD